MQAEEITEATESDKHDDEDDSVPIFEEEGGSSEAEGSSWQFETEHQIGDSYNFAVSIDVTETETEEVSAEFSDALIEIDVLKYFACSQCDKVCKSKGGLTRHTNSKHLEGGQLDETRVALCEDTVASFVESIKERIREENFYGTETTVCLNAVSSTVALFNALLPLYETFLRKKNQDKRLESFYGLIPRSSELLNCDKVENLITIHFPEYLIGFSNTSQTTAKDSSTTKPSELDPAEYGPLSYVAGYVIGKLHQLNRGKREKETKNYRHCCRT